MKNSLRYLKSLDNEKEELFNVEFPNIGVVWSKCSKSFNDEIRELCKKSKGNSSKANTLAGHISAEVDGSQEIEQLLLPKIFGACESMTGNMGDKEWVSLGTWINFQKKHEFNPFHRHSGVFSFVYWTQIPYNIEDEMNLEFVKNSTKPCASCFSLYYSSLIGEMLERPFNLDKKDEGMFVIFPSKMNHSVYPFYTSNEERISISGNIRFNVKDRPDVIPENFI